jgi:UDP-N-acetylmuramate: L-alanyl-gamma-D-glutamyl-meso-diaminopimelate ligase
MSEKGKIHFIAIGGSAMHNLALALSQNGYQVSGSDDEIFEPSKTRLQNAGILPEAIGWFPEKINRDLDAIILGMHARKDNPELLKAQELGLKVYSYPEFIYEQSKDKQRIVICGSHGKTTITSMILHVLSYYKRQFDYLVGAQLEGFETMAKLSDDSPIIIIEGDEYLSSPIDLTPKFLHYKHHVALISGISWDHINVFPTFDEYVRQFENLADASPKGGALIFNEDDDLVTVVCRKEREDVQQIEYKTPKYEIKNGITYLTQEDPILPVQIFGKHNLNNLCGAKAICLKIGITNSMFNEAIKSFKGASNRLETLVKNDKVTVFKDFAHAPSKLKATTAAVKEQFPKKELIAVLELHTFSSLNKKFLPQYKDCFEKADVPIVYYNPKTLEHKKLEPIKPEDITQAFNNKNLKVFTNSDELKKELLNKSWDNKVLLLMTSGNFDGISLIDLAKEVSGN